MWRQREEVSRTPALIPRASLLVGVGLVLRKGLMGVAARAGWAGRGPSLQSTRADDFVHRLDGTVGVADERALAVHIADLDEPWLGGPPVRGAGVFVEHRGGVVDLRAAVFAFVGDQALDRGAHPSGLLRAVGFEFRDPPILVGILVVAELVYGFLRPVAFVCGVSGEAYLQGTHIRHASGHLGTHGKAVKGEKYEGGQNPKNDDDGKDFNECESRLGAWRSIHARVCNREAVINCRSVLVLLSLSKWRPRWRCGRRGI